MKVFAPVNVGQVALKNRLVMSPMSTNMAKDGFITDEMIAFYVERAKGGAGLIFAEDAVVETPRGNHSLKFVAIDDDRYIPMLKRLTSAVHNCGAKIAVQLTHGGRRAGRVSKQTGCMEVTHGIIPVAPSPIAHPVTGQVVPKELSVEEIGELVRKFGAAAQRVVEAGFDVIGLHCAHMYLLGEFLSPWANQRIDEYGKTVEGRMRVVEEIIKEIYGRVDEKVPIICRMNGMDPEGEIRWQRFNTLLVVGRSRSCCHTCLGWIWRSNQRSKIHSVRHADADARQLYCPFS